MHFGAPSQVRQLLVAENQAHCTLSTHKQSSQEVCTAWQDTEKHFESVLTCSPFIKTILFIFAEILQAIFCLLHTDPLIQAELKV